jgi:hypothetical protein
MNDETIRRIGLYARDYILRFNELAPALANLGPPVSLLPVPISLAFVFPATDGAVVFYLSAAAAALQEEALRRPGAHSFPASAHPLAYLLPALTFNHIKVTVPPADVLRSDFSNLPDPRLLPDVPVMWIGASPEMQAAVRDGHRLFTAMAIAPIRRYEGGRVVEEHPTRVRVVSPIVDVGAGRLVREYIWSFADVLWKPERLDLDSERARLWAKLDIETLRLGVEGGLPQPQLFADPFEAVAQRIEDVTSQFEGLLDAADVNEAKVQEFLEVEGHRFLVSLVHQRMFPRKQLGRYVPDFTVLKPDNDYLFVEIENPRREMFQKFGEEPAAALTHAQTQVMDWLRYVDENRDTVRRVDGLPSIYLPTGEVVAGRDAHLSGVARERFEYMRAQPARVRLKTYDDVLREVRAHAAMLRRMRGSA